MIISKAHLYQLINEEIEALNEGSSPIDSAGQEIRRAFGVDPGVQGPSPKQVKAFERLQASLGDIMQLATQTESRQDILELFINFVDTISPQIYEPSKEELDAFLNFDPSDPESTPSTDLPYTGTVAGHKV